MKVLSSLHLPKRLYATMDSASYVEQIINSRMIGLSHLSGYPMASYVVGRIQNAINLTSIKECLESIRDLRDMAKLASDILYTAPHGRIDKNQYSRTEILAFVEMQGKLLGYASLTEDQKDLIAYMIVSSEAPDNAWLLNMPARPQDNTVVKLHTLYQSLSRVKDKMKVKTSGEKSDVTFTTSDAMYVYQSHSRKVEHLSASRRVVQLKNLTSITAGMGGAKMTELNNRIQRDYDDLVRITTIGHIRLLDHVTQLLVTTDVWAHFISARVKTDAASNIERARSLKIMSSYFHSLLTYHQHIVVEALRQGFDSVRDTFIRFPELPAHIASTFKRVVTDSDVLNASADIREWFDSFRELELPNHGTTVDILPAESVRISGIDDVMALATKAASKIDTPIPLTDLKSLGDDASYSYIMLSQPVSEFRIPTDVTDAILTGDRVQHEHIEAMSGLDPGMELFLPADMAEVLRGLNLRPTLSMVCKQAAFVDPAVGHHNIASQSVISMKANSPLRSRSARKYARKELLYTVDTASRLVTKMRGQVIDVIHREFLNKRLQASMGKEWYTLMPAQWFDGEEKYNHESLASSSELRKRLLETLFKQHFVMLEKHLGLATASRQYATYISSFASMYILNDANLDAAIADLSSQLVIGYGRPYGLEYTALAGKQNPITKREELIQITDNIFIKMHDCVPIPTNNLVIQGELQLDIPYYYYAGNGECMKVTDWVVVEGLPHMTLAPLSVQEAKHPIVFTDKRWAYLGDAVFIQANMLWSQPLDASATGTVNVPIVDNVWNRDRFMREIKYLNFGPYGTESVSDITETVTSDAGVLTEIVKEVEQEIKKIETAAPANNTDQAVKDPLASAVDIKPIDDTKKSNPGNSKSKPKQSKDKNNLDDAEGEDKKDDTKK